MRHGKSLLNRVLKRDVEYIHLGHGIFAMVDSEDFSRLNESRWYTTNRGGKHLYAMRVDKENRKWLKMHRIITGAPDGLEVDHINGDSLDNRRANLRVVTHRQNMMNKECHRKQSFIYSTENYSQA